MNKDYATLLANAPDHQSPEFITYLATNNKVISNKSPWYILIENCKYHSKERPWYTCFSKFDEATEPSKYARSIKEIFKLARKRYPTWQWLKHAQEDQTVKRWHIHLSKYSK